MNIFISVVSHGHSKLINELKCIDLLLNDFVVVVKSNKTGDDFNNLEESPNFHWLDEDYGLGFGANNNHIFEYCKNKLSMTNDDYFIVLNPDVIIDKISVYQLINEMKLNKVSLSSINLFKDENSYDNSIRRFPSLSNFVKSYIGLRNDTIIEKDKIKEPCRVDWAAGSFLAFKSGHYSRLGGFDEKYFMYCEDIDICYRSYLLNQSVVYYPDIKAIHLAKHANRKILSMHFYWHVTSVFRFLWSKYRLAN